MQQAFDGELREKSCAMQNGLHRLAEPSLDCATWGVDVGYM
jgi:hypothetical protein